MPRTLSWLDRIHPIARTVAGSARSHYDRKDLEKLFSIQPRSAQNLMSALPTVQVGRARLVERETLSGFLETLDKADDPAQAYAELRAVKGSTVRRKLRTLVLQDFTADVDALPGHMSLSPGELHVRFKTVEELAEAMLYLAAVLRDNLEVFAARYEPAPERTAEQRELQERLREEAKFYGEFRDKSPDV